ncbi:MAG: branched-chain alpha-keto acid dehydrogenase subunit [Rhodoglobus sp.]|nr:branched-chain alpha-keto acid dehydrogenase subunit [Rhodoglobus sp.]
MKDFVLPDLGEGLTESEIVEWHVAVGDRVTLNQTLADVETAKAIVQLPSPFEGVIGALYAEPGSTVRVGAPIVGFESADAPAAVARNPVLVGYGAPVETGDRPKRKARSLPAAASPEQPVFVAPRGAALSTPPVRKLAHDLGVDLELVQGTGEGGTVTREDVRAAASGAPVAVVASAAGDRRIPIKGVRKATAAAMVASAFTAPHVTEFLTVDVTRSSELVERLKAAGERASMLAVVAKALCIAVSRNPSLNSRWDETDIVEFAAVSLGIAVATPRGLMVPNIPGAQGFTLGALTEAIAALAAKARAGEITPAELSGGTISITNVGVFGVDAGTPILNPGEAAILAMGAVRRLPWEFEGQVALRDVMTLSLSFDHRLVDGEQAARFLTDIGRVLVDPATVLALV